MTQIEKVKQMLEDAGDSGVTTQEFLQAYIPRFSARILELREQGLDIETLPYKKSCKRYVLHEKPQYKIEEVSETVSQLAFV